MKVIDIKERLNSIPHVNDFLDARNHEMDPGDRLECHVLTAKRVREAIKRRFPYLIRYIVIFFTYVWHNMFPKMRLTRKFYFWLAGERDRMYSRTEVLGRICRAGFRIVGETNRGPALLITAEKVSDPLPRNETCVSPIVRLPRVGKDGKIVQVYKFRTMHSYAQYLQEYVYEQNNLSPGGKLKNDFRINIWGKFMRPIWLDELPMIWNWMKRDLKLVGVRPLSEQYFSLYTPEMQALRTRVKPGLIPPFYYEKKTPDGIDEVQESEKRYLEAYLKHPHRTDWRYFWGSVFNIIFRRKHSH